jgi:hypothetical protein
MAARAAGSKFGQWSPKYRGPPKASQVRVLRLVDDRPVGKWRKPYDPSVNDKPAWLRLRQEDAA